MLKSSPRPLTKAFRHRSGGGEPIGPLDPDVQRLIEAIARDMAKADHAAALGGAGHDD